LVHPEVSKQTAAVQECINEQTDKHGRQFHHRIDKCSDRFFSGEVKLAETKSRWYPYEQAASDGIAGHFYSSPNRGISFSVAAYQ